MTAENPKQPMRECPEPIGSLPELPDPAVALGIDKIIEAATGLTWAHFAARHPETARGIESNLGGKPIVPEIIAVLERDQAYDDLVAATALESDTARMIAGIGPIVLNAIRLIAAG